MIQRIIKWLTSIVATAIIIPFIQAPAAKLAEALGFDTAYSSRWTLAMGFLSDLSRNPWYIFATGSAVGLIVGLWLCRLLREHNTTGAIEKASHCETMVRVERDRSTPTQWRQTLGKNVFSFFQIWNYKPMVVIHEYGPGLPTANVTIPDLYPQLAPPVEPKPEQLDTFFIVFEKPIKYAQIRIEGFGQLFPNHDTYCATERSAILYLRQQLPDAMTVFEVHFIS